MRRLVPTLLIAATMALLPGGASADSPNTGCREGWVIALAVSEDALKVDRNGDGWGCAKFVPGRGNGIFLLPHAVATDNNSPIAAG